VSLLLAFSRPLQLRRILPMACQLGLDHIVLSNARKLPRDYFGLSLLRKPEMLRGLLVEELTISSDVSLLDVVVTGNLGAFLEDELDGRKRRQRLGGTRGIRQTAGGEHKDAGRGFPERRRRRRTADDTGHDRDRRRTAMAANDNGVEQRRHARAGGGRPLARDETG